MKYLIYFIILFFPFQLMAQYPLGISLKWDDSFAEWTIFYETAEGEEEEGELRVRFPGKSIWADWDYDLGNASGTAKMKWDDKPDEWEFRGDGNVLTARTLRRGYFNEWRITDNDTQLTFKTRYSNQIDEWILRETEFGNFQIYTSYEGDPREWVIVDELNEDISIHTKMAMIFLAVYHSLPRE